VRFSGKAVSSFVTDSVQSWIWSAACRSSGSTLHTPLKSQSYIFRGSQHGGSQIISLFHLAFNDIRLVAVPISVPSPAFRSTLTAVLVAGLQMKNPFLTLGSLPPHAPRTPEKSPSCNSDALLLANGWSTCDKRIFKSETGLIYHDVGSERNGVQTITTSESRVFTFRDRK
jgi:hypothetical protein